MSNQLATVSAGIGFVVVFLYANLFEYAFHRWLMHRLHRYVSQPYETHVRLHHRIFRGDQRYHVLRAEHRSVILFAWCRPPAAGPSSGPASPRSACTTGSTNTFTGACTTRRAGASSGPGSFALSTPTTGSTMPAGASTSTSCVPSRTSPSGPIGRGLLLAGHGVSTVLTLRPCQGSR